MEQVKTALAGALQNLESKKTGAPEFCEKHRVDFDYMPNSYELACPQCHKENKLEEIRRLGISAAHEELNLPPRLASCSFDNYRPVNAKAKKALADCKAFAANPAGGLIMIGEVGTGKTHLAAAICKAMCDRGEKCRLITVPELIRSVRATWKDQSDESEQDVVRRYGSYALLCIDEIGTMHGTESEKVIITEIINVRYNNMLPTVVIGNVSISEAELYLGARVIDRIRHGGKQIFFEWESWRKK